MRERLSIKKTEDVAYVDGQVVQIAPEGDPTFGGCFLTCYNCTPQQVKGFVMMPMPDGAKKSLVKVDPSVVSAVGVAVWP